MLHTNVGLVQVHDDHEVLGAEEGGRRDINSAGPNPEKKYSLVVVMFIIISQDEKRIIQNRDFHQNVLMLKTYKGRKT